MTTNSTQDTAQWLQETKRALDALKRAETSPNTEGVEAVYHRQIGGMVFAIDDHGCGSIFRAADADGHMLTM